MVFEVKKNVYSGKIREVTLGSGDKAVTLGGESAYSFYLYEGAMPNKPRIAMEVWDTAPDDWADECLKPFADVIGDPVAWAKKCVSEYGADAICLQLVSTDPNGMDRPADEAAAVVKQVADAIDVPLIVWGTANHDKDTDVLRAVAELCQGQKLTIGPLEEADHKKIGAAIIGYGHTAVSSTPIDINLAKQLNILLGNLGVADDKIVMDPTVSAIGYGIEYCYSVMERVRQAALLQQDERLQFPFICNISKETWKTKESKVDPDDATGWGDLGKRGILMEAMSAAAVLMAGADLLIMRHPEAIKLTREIIDDLSVASN